MPIKWKTAIITLSDKGYAGEREDKSGPLVREMIERAGYEVKLILDDQVGRGTFFLPTTKQISSIRSC